MYSHIFNKYYIDAKQSCSSWYESVGLICELNNNLIISVKEGSTNTAAFLPLGIYQTEIYMVINVNDQAASWLARKPLSSLNILVINYTGIQILTIQISVVMLPAKWEDNPKSSQKIVFKGFFCCIFVELGKRWSCAPRAHPLDLPLVVTNNLLTFQGRKLTWQ